MLTQHMRDRIGIAIGFQRRHYISAPGHGKGQNLKFLKARQQGFGMKRQRDIGPLTKTLRLNIVGPHINTHRYRTGQRQQRQDNRRPRPHRSGSRRRCQPCSRRFRLLRSVQGHAP